VGVPIVYFLCNWATCLYVLIKSVTYKKKEFHFKLEGHPIKNATIAVLRTNLCNSGYKV
jgi:hypothetical protein